MVVPHANWNTFWDYILCNKYDYYFSASLRENCLFCRAALVSWGDCVTYHNVHYISCFLHPIASAHLYPIQLKVLRHAFCERRKVFIPSLCFLTGSLNSQAMGMT